MIWQCLFWTDSKANPGWCFNSMQAPFTVPWQPTTCFQ